MRTSSVAIVAAGLLTATGLAYSQTQQADYSTSTSSPTEQRDSSQAPTKQLRPAQATTGQTIEQESPYPSGTGMTPMPRHGRAQPDRLPLEPGMINQTPSGAQYHDDTGMLIVRKETENGISYMCGGVGADEASYMKQQARNYDLMLTFSTRAGNYLADVNVDLKDSKGNMVLSTTCDAPILLVDLPHSGIYHVKAQAGDYSLNRTVSVKGKGRTSAVAMAWAQEPMLPEAPAPMVRGQGIGSSGSDSGSGPDRNDDDLSRPQQRP